MSVLPKAGQEVDITKVSPQQLQELGQAIEGEVKQLSMYFQQIHQAINKFEDSKKVVNYLNLKSTNKDVMVPLTSSLYVPGKLDETNNVMLEVGGGYFIEKDLEGAKDYCDRKISKL